MRYNNIKAIIFDRDGTLIEHVHYLSNPNEVKLLSGVKIGIRLLKELGFVLFLHTNQSGVGRNYFDIEAVFDCNKRMEELLGLDFKVFDRICIATEKPDDPILYRKPSSRFVTEIIRDYGFKSEEICCIGDRLSDLQVALEIGCKAIGINTGLISLKNELEKLQMKDCFEVADNFRQVINLLLNKNL